MIDWEKLLYHECNAYLQSGAMDSKKVAARMIAEAIKKAIAVEEEKNRPDHVECCGKCGKPMIHNYQGWYYCLPCKRAVREWKEGPDENVKSEAAR